MEDITFLKKKAEQGNPDALFKLGYCYFYGQEGLSVDHSKAREYLTKAASAGSITGACLLGEFLEFVANDSIEALYYYQMAAEAGFPHAQWATANLYYTGKGGIKRDNEKAVYWYRQAALNDVKEAQFVMGELCRTGLESASLEKDTNQALSWYKKSEVNGYEPAAIRIKLFFPNGIFQDRKPVTDNKPIKEPVIVSEISSLQNDIVTCMRSHDFIPQDELPNIPELASYIDKIVTITCSSVNDDMKLRGLNENEMRKLFEFVFLKAYDIAYQWHKSSDGKIESELIMSNPFKDNDYLQMPKEILMRAREIKAPQIICDVMFSWWLRNNKDLIAKGIDIWSPLSRALLLTALTAISIALKMFGYRQ
jgi:hypothetical protein